MARMRDFHRAIQAVGWWELAKRVYRELSEDNLLTWACALAYSWLFAFFPFLLFLLSLVPHLPEPVRSGADGVIKSALDAMPSQASQSVWASLQTAMHKSAKSVGFSLVLTLLISLWAASGGMSYTMAALDRCYELKNRGRSTIKRRIWAIALTIIVVFLILLVMFLLPLGSLIMDWFRKGHQGAFSDWVFWAWNIGRYTLALLLLIVTLSIVYYFGTSVKQKFRFITPGAIFSVTVWIVLGLAFRFYVNHFGKYDATYGSLAGVAILLLFFYIDSLVLLIGAELNSEVEFATGIPRGSLDFRDDRPRPNPETDETTDFEPQSP